VARILAIDYGLKRTGIATTDPLQIIASGLDTVASEELLDFLDRYLSEEAVETIVLGEPLHADGAPAHLHHLVLELKTKLEKLFPEVNVVLQDERFSSREAKEVILRSGAKKKKRRDKGLVDKVSAAIILQDYLEGR
jgi:putative Holliday junction resolvase